MAMDLDQDLRYLLIFMIFHSIFANWAGVNFLYFCAANAVARLGIFQKYQDWDGRFEGVLNKK